MTQEQIEAVKQWLATHYEPACKQALAAITALQARLDEAEKRSDMLDDCNARQFGIIATLRAAIAEALAEVDTWKQVPQRGSIKRQLERILLRNLTKPEAPSERIMSDKDRENPVEGAHPTQPEPEDALVELQDCPPGLFCFNGTLGFKSEYTTTLENPRRYQCDAYVVESGEYFHGGAKSTADRAKLMVRPIEIDQLALASRGLVRGEGVER